MKTAALLLQVGHFGFLGMSGFAGFLVALIIFIVIAVIAFHILKLVLPKLIPDSTWAEVVKWLVILLLFLLFLHFCGIY